MSHKLLLALDRFFDRLYSSRLNPLYRSGTIAVTLLLIVITTGAYLLFFYRVGAPYESILEINSVFINHTIRSVHRYASDLCVLVVIYHVFRMIAEGKTWGPKTLSWVTGVVLMLVMFVIGWTGFVLVWDSHAQTLVKAGADMLDTVPFISGIATRSISGAAQVGTSFFFLNLFLHMSLPLGMIFLLWLHTSKLSRPAWLLPRKYFIAVVLFLVLLAVVKQAPVDEPANLLKLSNEIQLNWYYGFVIPMVNTLTPAGSFLTMLIFFVSLTALPWWWPKQKVKTSVHNPLACTGCGQCAMDCPFTAIDMIPRQVGEGSETTAFVDVSSCVGCGICAASCSQMAIGPEDKSIRNQLRDIKELKASYTKEAILLVCCESSSLGKAYLDWQQKNKVEVATYAISCTGNFHASSAFFALGHFAKVVIIGCPSHSCINRLGQKLLEERFLAGRDPQPPGGLDLSRIQIFSGSISDFDSLILKKENKVSQGLKAILASGVVLAATAIFSAFTYNNYFEKSVLRLAVRFPSQVTAVCTQRTEEELKKLPMHMRSPKVCTQSRIDYDLQVVIDNEVVLTRELKSGGLRGDRPVIVEEDLLLTPGRHVVKVNFIPKTGAESAESLELEADFNENFEQGRALLVYYNQNTKALTYSKSSVK